MIDLTKVLTFRLEGNLKSEAPLATCSKDLKETVGKDEPIPVPSMDTELGKRLYFPAAGLRGAIRRAARNMVRARIIADTNNPHPFDLDTHYMLTIGGNKGKGTKERTTITMEADVRAKNPLLSVFGAGDAGVLGFIEGHLGMGNAVCKNATLPVKYTPKGEDIPVQAMQASGVRTDIFREPTQMAYLSDADNALLFTKSEGNSAKSKINNEINDLKKEYVKAKKAKDQDKMDMINALIAAKKLEKDAVHEESGADDNSILMPLVGFLAIPQGEILAHTMTLKRSNMLELGFLLHSLNAFAIDNPIIGAHFAVGCGEVSGQWKVRSVSLNKADNKVLGDITMTPYDSLQVTGELVEAMQAFDDFMASKQWNFNVPTKAVVKEVEKKAA